jgi:predicted dienelactone hydrolase
MRHGLGVFVVLGLAVATATAARDAPSRPGIDAPELARLGSFQVGVRTTTLVDAAQVDVLAWDSATGTAPTRDRELVVDLWYPAGVAEGAAPETYSGRLPAEPPAPPSRFTIPGVAVRDAAPATGRYPLVVISHGYSNATIAFSWLSENLASKGYVVAAIRHEDPPITDRSRFAEPLLRRPLDIAFVTRTLQRTLAGEGLIDPSRTSLVGYSMGGYGVLTVGGGVLDPASPLAQIVPGGLLAPYARGGVSIDDVRAPGIKAIVAFAPGGGSLRAWGADGLGGITAPLMLIAGDRDWTVDYQTGARAFFDMATNSRRYLLTFRGAGHRIALGPAPDEMRGRLWDFDWFEDPVWRQDRIVAINLHMITAFLDRYVKDDASRAPYLDGLTRDSIQGDWPASAAQSYDAYSPGADGITVWKGFQRGHAEGLELLHEVPR